MTNERVRLLLICLPVKAVLSHAVAATLTLARRGSVPTHGFITRLTGGRSTSASMPGASADGDRGGLPGASATGRALARLRPGAQAVDRGGRETGGLLQAGGRVGRGPGHRRGRDRTAAGHPHDHRRTACRPTTAARGRSRSRRRRSSAWSSSAGGVGRCNRRTTPAWCRRPGAPTEWTRRSRSAGRPTPSRRPCGGGSEGAEQGAHAPRVGVPALLAGQDQAVTLGVVGGLELLATSARPRGPRPGARSAGRHPENSTGSGTDRRPSVGGLRRRRRQRVAVQARP